MLVIFYILYIYFDFLLSERFMLQRVGLIIKALFGPFSTRQYLVSQTLDFYKAYEQ